MSKIIPNWEECYEVGDGLRDGLQEGVRDYFMVRGGLCKESTFQLIIPQ